MRLRLGRLRAVWVTGVLVFLVGGLGLALLWGRGPAAGEGTTEPRRWAPPPEEFLARARERGTTGTIHYEYLPPPENPGEPVNYGPYRIIPWGYTRPLPRTELPRPEPGVVSRDPAVLRRSSLWVEPAYLPPGFSLVQADTYDAHSELIIHQVYKGGQASLEVLRKRVVFRPVDVYQWREGDLATLKTGRVGDYPAVFLMPTPGNERFKRYEVRFIDRNGVETIVGGFGLEFDEVLRVATALAQN